MIAEDFARVQRFAVRFSPPSVAVELVRGSAGSEKCSVVEFTLANLEESSGAIARAVRDRLDTKDLELSARQNRCLCQAVDKLKDWHAARKALAQGEDLNVVAPGVLDQAKMSMSVQFEQNRIKPGDEGYAYDKRESFADHLSEGSWD